MADVELLPCPFCGSAPRFYSEDGKAVCVLCGECGASSDFWHADHADHDAKAASAWNTRANLAPLHAENERLAKALRDAEKSLRTIANRAGGTEYLMTIGDVRGYANSRANEARAGLAQEDRND